MTAEARLRRWCVLTPARNEAQNLPRLAEALAAQSIPPAQWLILENGSTDDTLRTAEALAARHAFARVHVVPARREAPVRGGPIVRALHSGLQAVDADAGMVLKIDADISVEKDYAERLVAAFAQDAQLGIASGTCYELHGGAWRQQHMTGHMVWCAARAWRRECLDAILPFEECFGWDGIDVARARLRGWRTRLFTDLQFRHHRSEGERDGLPGASWITQGRGSHYLGYRPSYVVLRALGRARKDPRALLMIWGYVSQVLRRAPHLADEEVRRLIRDEQRWRVLGQRMRESLGQRA